MASPQTLEPARGVTAPAITACRMTGSSRLESVLDLGLLALTGRFPKPDEAVPTAPLEVVLCPEGGLVQLRHTADLRQLYGPGYGYRSGLNRSMIRHLTTTARALEARLDLRPGDVVLDIGSNDGTLLSAYRPNGLYLYGIDPRADQFKETYPPRARTASDFFSLGTYRRLAGGRQARLVTSIAMFYDLEHPLAFMQDIASLLADDGLWYTEQSYLPALLDACAYDTICHEHLAYYGLRQIQWMAERSGLQILDVRETATNGGSFAVTLAKRTAKMRVNQTAIDQMLALEVARGLDRPEFFAGFVAAVRRHQRELPGLIRALRAAGKTVLGYGASTKGNVLLQTCGLTAKDLPCIAEVNPDKFGRVTPGTQIPIVSEAEAKAQHPDYFLVLPWHFRETIIQREQAFLKRDGTLIFPLPTIAMVKA